jgi:hypothetical protein
MRSKKKKEPINTSIDYWIKTTSKEALHVNGSFPHLFVPFFEIKIAN